ncbi:GAF domain-containing protein [Rhodopseudomonas sp. P2A-2r]|uniref:GAF domain-containing protein n=1 Tax=Rhodopseudomonas sp. P2A-2r TaxID=2991972 RepID=UPI0022340ADF|nr:GAF domain-containing protein [Rhodopseudomonas sp. P2A-2r]UZE50096.1 GAF domain-containing protein [Rhodopseudomonas sp. P2A-2r]
MQRPSSGAHIRRVERVIAGAEAASSALAASWRRSGRLHALDPASNAPSLRLTESEVHQAQHKLGPLLRAAQATLDRLLAAVGSVGCCVLLSDRDGIVVDRRGAQGDDRTFESWGLWTGAIWSEQYEGTNGIGTCLAEERALTIHRDQHFFSRNSLLSCTTVPIFDEHGEIAAALDVSSCRADSTEGFVQLIAVAAADAARHIEAENFRLAFPDARIVLAPGSERAGRSLLAVDHDDLVIGATRAARMALGINAATLARPIPAADLIGQVNERHDDLETAERAVLQRALARADGNVSKAAKDLDMSRATLHRKMRQLALHR